MEKDVVEPLVAKKPRVHSEIARSIGYRLSAAMLPDGKIDQAAFEEVLPDITKYARTAARRSLDQIGMLEREDEIVQDVVTRIVRELQRLPPHLAKDGEWLTNIWKSWLMAPINGHWRHTTRGQPRLVFVGLQDDGSPLAPYAEMQGSTLDDRLESRRHARYRRETNYIDNRELLPLLIDFRRQWPRLSWPDRHILRALMQADGNISEVGRQIGVHKQSAWKYVRRAIARLNGDEPCTHWDKGRCLGSAIRWQGRIVVALPMGAEEWVRDGAKVRVGASVGEARVQRSVLAVSELLGMEGLPTGERLPAITDIWSVDMAPLLECGGEVRISGPSFVIEAHALPS